MRLVLGTNCAVRHLLYPQCHMSTKKHSNAAGQSSRGSASKGRMQLTSYLWKKIGMLWKSYGISFLGICTNPVSLCLDLVLVHPNYPSSSWKWIASCNNNLVWALKVYYPCVHAYICCQEQLALDLLSTKTVEEWYKAFTQQKSKLCTYISSLLILSYLLILTNFCPGEANF